MKRVTLYRDDDAYGWFYHNGEKWRYKPYGLNWRDCINQNWLPSDFDKSLTVNNFKEK